MKLSKKYHLVFSLINDLGQQGFATVTMDGFIPTTAGIELAVNKYKHHLRTEDGFNVVKINLLNWKELYEE